MVNKWIKIGNTYKPLEAGMIEDLLPSGVYKLEETMQGFQLVRSADNFMFPYKIYGMDEALVNRTVKSFMHLDGNLGVLMNGIKGSGKTVTAKRISNILIEKLDMPVIIISHKHGNIEDFINSVQQGVVIFFDEYEKIYTNHEHNILTVMDGVLTTEHKKLFLLTTNESYVNTNMLQRPGRIRYFKTFDDLLLETIIEVVDDKLTFTKVRDELIKFVSGLEIITIDVIKALVDECNLHEEGPDAFKDVFNVKPIENVFNVFEIKDGTERIKFCGVQVNPLKFTPKSVGKNFYIKGRYYGVIKAVLSDDIIVTDYATSDIEGIEDDEEVLSSLKEAPDKIVTTTYRIERGNVVHKSFNSYAF